MITVAIPKTALRTKTALRKPKFEASLSDGVRPRPEKSLDDALHGRIKKSN
ncbi:MAG: hypothetical protein Q7R47_03605 [Candidatus Diapherotrites archaeon]|nr:hypothetical protein [Candidatus Diapherotrites archaeon]